MKNFSLLFAAGLAGTFALGLSSPASAASQSQVLPFATDDQSLWAPIADPTPPDLSQTFNLFHETWDEGPAGGSWYTNGQAIIDAMGLAGAVIKAIIDILGHDPEDDEFGGSVSGHTRGHVGMDLEIDNIELGSVDVDYPIRVDLVFPDANTFRPGDAITIASSYTIEPGARLDTVPPNIDLRLAGSAALDMGFTVEVCLFDCSEPGVADLPSFNEPDFTLFSIDDSEEALVPLLAGKIGLPHTFGVLETQATGISGTIDRPTVNTSFSQAGDGALSASGAHRFIDLTVDLDSYLSKLPKVPPLGVRTPEVAGATLWYEIIDFDYGFDVTGHREVGFQAVPKVALGFDQAVAYQVLDGATVIDSGNASTVRFDAGHSVRLVFPAGRTTPIATGPGFDLLDNTFSHLSYDVVEQVIIFRALGFELQLPARTLVSAQCWGVRDKNGNCIGISVPTVRFGGVDVGPFGPLAEENLTDIPDDTLVHFPPGGSTPASWPLGGFSTFTGSVFALDPENPRLRLRKETSHLVNNGGGSHDLLFALEVTNSGDMPLRGLQIEDALVATFPPALADYTVDAVHSCELSVNGDFDGQPGNARLLTGTDVLDDTSDPNPPPIGGTVTRGLVWVETTVRPQPFPPEFENWALASGRSWFLDTPVGEWASAPVHLGPSRVDRLEDFVLYADHKVQFKDAGFVRGTVGSNGSIEIQRGDSGVVAGDLRALETVQVHGRVVADYVYSNTWVNVTGRGELDLSGGIVEWASQPAQTLPVLLFSAETGPAVVVEPVAPGDPVPLLAPGRYAAVTLAPGAMLQLASGEYFIRWLTLEPGARLAFDPQILLPGTDPLPVTVNVGHRLDLGAGAELLMAPDTAGSTRDVALNLRQSGNLRFPAGARLAGVITAPEAELSFGPGSRLQGAAYARFIRLEEGVEVAYHDDWSGELYRELDLDCDGTPDVRMHNPTP